MQEWLGIYTMKAWAIAANRSIRIWKHLNEDTHSRELYLLKQYCAPDSLVFIDILYTNQSTHFERLTLVSNEEHQEKQTQSTLYHLT